MIDKLKGLVGIHTKGSIEKIELGKEAYRQYAEQLEESAKEAGATERVFNAALMFNDIPVVEIDAPNRYYMAAVLK